MSCRTQLEALLHALMASLLYCLFLMFTLFFSGYHVVNSSFDKCALSVGVISHTIFLIFLSGYVGTGDDGG